MIRGVILGGIWGDTLGSKFEGTRNIGIYSDAWLKNNPNCIANVKNKIIIFNKNNNYYTDDSDMTILEIQSIIQNNGNIDPKHITLYIANKFSPSRRYSSATKSLLTEISDHPEKWNSAYKFHHEDGSFGNGSIMRISPVGLLYLTHQNDKQLLIDIKNVLSSIHCHPESIECCVLFCKLMRDLIITDNWKILIKRLLNNNISNRTKQLLFKIQKLLSEKQTFDILDLKQKCFGFFDKAYPLRVSNTFATVIYCLLYHLKFKIHNPPDIIKNMIFVGGDTDTNASLIGNLLGIRFKDTWIDTSKLENIEQIETIIAQFKKIIMEKIKSDQSNNL